jgi:2-haloacid dehalogenase
MTFSPADPQPHADLIPHPRVVVLDVNETLTDMRPLAQRLRDVGAPAHLLATWFAGTLRDGIALTLAGGYADFAQVAAAVLRSLLAGAGSVGTSTTPSTMSSRRWANCPCTPTSPLESSACANAATASSR